MAVRSFGCRHSSNLILSCFELSPSLNRYFEYFLNNICPSSVIDQYQCIGGRYFLRRGFEGSLRNIFEEWLRQNAISQVSGQASNMTGNEFYSLIYSDWPIEHTLYEGGL